VSWDLSWRVLASLIILGWAVAENVYGSDFLSVWVGDAIALALVLCVIAFKLVRRAPR